MCVTGVVSSVVLDIIYVHSVLSVTPFATTVKRRDAMLNYIEPRNLQTPHLIAVFPALFLFQWLVPLLFVYPMQGILQWSMEYLSMYCFYTQKVQKMLKKNSSKGK